MVRYSGRILKDGFHSLFNEPLVGIELDPYHIGDVLNLLDFGEVDSFGVAELGEMCADLLRIYFNSHSDTISVSL